MNYHINQLSPVVALLAAPLAFGAQHTGTATVIYSEIATDSSSADPALSGFTIDGLGTPNLSPDGSHWAMIVNADTGSTADDVRLILDGNVVVLEGTSPSYLAGRTHGFVDTKIGVHDSGALCFTADLTGDTATDDVVLYSDSGGTISLVAQEGSQIAGAPVGWLHGSVNSAIITDGGAGYRVTSIVGGPVSPMDDAIMAGAAVLLQTGVDIPAGQLSGAMDAYNGFDSNDFFVSSDGSNYLIKADLVGASTLDDAIVVNGTVVMQESFALPSSPADFIGSNGIDGVYMHDSGNWAVFGEFASTDRFAIYNGGIVARSGQPIFSGSTETYVAGGDFIVATCNSTGSYLVAGQTDNPNSNLDEALVLNGTELVCRKGDPVDLDGNGTFDDNVFIAGFNDEEAFLTNAMEVYLNVSLTDDLGTDLGECFMKIELGDDLGLSYCFGDGTGTACPCGNSGAAGEGCANSSGAGATLTASGSTLVALDDLNFQAAGLLPSQPALLFAGVNAVNAGAGSLFGDGLRCAGGSVVRLGVASPDASGDATWGPILSAQGGWVSGDTRRFQAWYRDPSVSPCGAGFNLSNGIEIDFQ